MVVSEGIRVRSTRMSYCSPATVISSSDLSELIWSFKRSKEKKRNKQGVEVEGILAVGRSEVATRNGKL